MRRPAATALVVVTALGVLALEGCTSSGEDQQTGGTLATLAPTTVATTVAPTTTEATTTTTTTTVPPTTTTTIPLITKNAVVKVANAAGIPGAAARFTEVLARIGYATAAPTDAAGYATRLDRSRVFFLPKAEKAATRLAELMGVKARPMPTPVPILEANYALGDATIVVMLGEDLADEPIPGLTDR